MRNLERKWPRVDHYAKNAAIDRSALFRLWYFAKTFHFLAAQTACSTITAALRADPNLDRSLQVLASTLQTDITAPPLTATLPPPAPPFWFSIHVTGVHRLYFYFLPILFLIRFPYATAFFRPSFVSFCSFILLNLHPFHIFIFFCFPFK
jgi:hypothetical protein